MDTPVNQTKKVFIIFGGEHVLMLPVGAYDNFARLEQYNHMMIASGYDEEGGVDEKKDCKYTA
ncbi:hypothetical protein ACQYE5_003029 [Enterobacter cancerogenus]